MSISIFICDRRLRHPREVQRAEDTDLLRALVALIDGDEDGGLTMAEATAFADMQDVLRRASEAVLSESQREWATRRASQLGLSWGDPRRRNADVPRGREVPVPEVLRVLPKKPPRRAP